MGYIEKDLSSYKKWQILYKILLIATAICIVICFRISIKRGIFIPIILLPIALESVLFFNRANRIYINNLSIIICNVVFFCRYAFYPVTVMLSLDEAYKYATNAEVVNLMIYELIAVNFIIAFKAKKLNYDGDKNREQSGQLGIVSLLLIGTMLLAILLEPSLINRFSLSITTNKSNDAVSTINTLFQMGLWSTIVCLITSLQHKEKKSRAYYINFLFAAMVCIYFLLFNMVSSSNIHRWKIIVGCLSLGYLLMESFPAHKKVIVRVATIGVILGVFFGTFAKFDTQVNIADFANTYVGSYRNLDEYFSGVRNIQFGLDMIKSTPESQTIISTLTDFFSGMPIVSRLFSEGTKNSSIIIMYQAFTGRKDIICPLLIQSIAHFGKIGAPIMSMIMMCLAIDFNCLLKRTKSMYVAFVCIEATFYCSLFMGLNTMIIMGVVWIRLIYIILMRFNTPVCFGSKGR